MSASQSATRLRSAEAPRVVMLDRDVKRTLQASKAFDSRGYLASTHLTSEGFWVAVPKIRPTVLVLEVVPPLLSAVRNYRLAHQMIGGKAPGLVLYGWAPAPALARLVEEIPGAILLDKDQGAEKLCETIETVHRALYPSVDDEGDVEKPGSGSIRRAR